MKKTVICMAVLLVATLSASSFAKSARRGSECPVSCPRGPAGPAGPVGPAGPSSDLIYIRVSPSGEVPCIDTTGLDVLNCDLSVSTVTFSAFCEPGDVGLTIPGSYLYTGGDYGATVERGSEYGVGYYTRSGSAFLRVISNPSAYSTAVASGARVTTRSVRAFKVCIDTGASLIP